MARWWWRGALLLLGAFALVLATRCHLPRQTVSETADSTSAVYLVRHGWHAGIAVHRAEVPDERWPVLDDFDEVAFLEVGWGDARYFPDPDPGVGSLLRAGLWPTTSVLHVVPISGRVTATFPQNTVVRIPVGPEEIDALTTFIAESFELDETGDAPIVAPGYLSGSHFYPSRLRYHVFNNCNHWAAAALEAAGCDVSPRWAFTVGQVIGQAESCGTLLQRRPDD